MSNRDAVYEEMLRRAEDRSAMLNDPCKHLTRCADAACSYRMADAQDERDIDEIRLELRLGAIEARARGNDAQEREMLDRLILFEERAGR